MPSTSIAIRIDEDLEKDVEITADPFYSESNQAYLQRAISALDAGKGVEHDLIEVDD